MSLLASEMALKALAQGDTFLIFAEQNCARAQLWEQYSGVTAGPVNILCQKARGFWWEFVK